MTSLERFVSSRPTARSDDDEDTLWSAFTETRGIDARERLFAAYLPFARGIAGRHFADRTGGDIEFPDLLQLACAGLLEAIDGFDNMRGVPFRAYAAKRISGSVLNGIAKASEIREQIAYQKRTRRERMESLLPEDQPFGKTTDALAELAELAIGLAVGFMLEGTGLYGPDEAVVATPNAYESLVWREMVAEVDREVTRLPERQGLIIRYHYLSGLNFDRIGALLKISKSRVSQLHRAAMDQLRARLGKAPHFRLER